MFFFSEFPANCGYGWFDRGNNILRDRSEYFDFHYIYNHVPVILSGYAVKEIPRY